MTIGGTLQSENRLIFRQLQQRLDPVNERRAALERNGQSFEGRFCSRANSTVERQPANFCSGPIPAASLGALLPV